MDTETETEIKHTDLQEFVSEAMQCFADREGAYAAIQDIVKAWEGGDLAGAVNNAAGLVPDDFVYMQRRPSESIMEEMAALMRDQGIARLVAPLHDTWEGQALVVVWADGSVSLSTRSRPDLSWGPPVEMTEDQS